LARAQTPQTHVLLVPLPGGEIEQIRYKGNVPPIVILPSDSMNLRFAPGFPFDTLNRITQAMNHQAEVLFHDVNSLTALNASVFGTIPILSGPPASGTGVCMRSIQITFTGTRQAPNVVSQSAGDCGPAGSETVPATRPNAPADTSLPNLVLAKSTPADQHLVRAVGNWQQ
jgi:hypothetical protein